MTELQIENLLKPLPLRCSKCNPITRTKNPVKIT